MKMPVLPLLAAIIALWSSSPSYAQGHYSPRKKQIDETSRRLEAGAAAHRRRLEAMGIGGKRGGGRKGDCNPCSAEKR
ncbi:hypothetical protein OCUBac02_32440 [Bosea sp. ANAM02]|nr:hypothetical protein OCUBac02_32440 [Bosea sp. ANAM02]